MAYKESTREESAASERNGSGNEGSKIGVVAGLSNLVFSGGLCGIVLGLGTLLSPGCLLYLVYTSAGVGILGSVTAATYEHIPGSSMAAKMSLLLIVAFGLFLSGVLLPVTPTLNKPVSVTFNMVYFAAAALVSTSAIAYMSLRLNGQSAKDVVCEYC